MPRFQPTTLDTAPDASKPLLEAVQSKLGRVPNIYGTMAHAPAVLKFALQGSGILGETSLSAAVREQIALTVAGANQCEYCAAAHTAIGKMNGLDDDQTTAALRAEADDPQAQAAVTLARQLVEREGHPTDDQIAAFKAAGYGDQQVQEIIAVVAFNIFTNYFNHVAQTDIDFPQVELPEAVGAVGAVG
ncbi:MAG: carboxymuconolactone decarboxylase family protein [Planctomycetota bacterium]